MGQRSILCRAGSVFLLPLILATGYAQESAVLGPVDQVERDVSSITVLGQTYAVPASAAVVINSKRYAAADSLRLIRLGTYVSVAGTENEDGQLVAQEILVSRREYVPGASDVFVSGLVKAYDGSTGIALIGALRIDTTVSLGSNSSPAVGVGSRIEVFGRQAVPGGVLWTFGLEVISSVEAESISGTGSSLQSISGTGGGLQSISGTGAGLQSISGTGT